MCNNTDKKNNSFKGGLIAHLLLTAKYAISINETLPTSLKQTKSTLLKVSFLHQIGKAKLYSNESIDAWQTKRGINYTFNESVVSMRVGERSAIYALSNGVKLTEAEFQAIVNHDKEDSDSQSRWYTETLGVILRMANNLAILEEKDKYGV